MSIRNIVYRLDEIEQIMSKLVSEKFQLQETLKERGVGLYLAPHYQIAVYRGTSKHLSMDKLLKHIPIEVLDRCYSKTAYMAVRMTKIGGE